MTLTIELDEPDLAKLAVEAEGRGVTVEGLVRELVWAHTRRGSVGIPASDAAFRAAMEGTFRDNDELYRRLAK